MSRPGLKVASFTLKADARQSVRWKRASEAEGFPSVGAWAALALDAYLDLRLKAGMPVPLAWRPGHFSARLESGELQVVKGWLSPPFGAFEGSAAGPAQYDGRHLFSLVLLADGRVLATLKTYRECRALAAELARTWVRWGGKEPPGKPAEDVIRSMR